MGIDFMCHTLPQLLSLSVSSVIFVHWMKAQCKTSLTVRYCRMLNKSDDSSLWHIIAFLIIPKGIIFVVVLTH